VRDDVIDLLTHSGALSTAQISAIRDAGDQALLDALQEYEAAAAKAVAERLGEPVVVFDASTLNLHATRLLPRDFAEEHAVLAIQSDDLDVEVACANPASAPLHELTAITGLGVRPVRALEPLLRVAIADAYSAADAGHTRLSGERAPGDAPEIVCERPDADDDIAHMDALVRRMAASMFEVDEGVELDGLDELDALDDLPVVTGALLSEEGPAAPPPAAPLDPLPADVMQARQIVLVVEDDAAIRKLVARALRGPHVAVVEAADGNEGLEHLRRRAPDLVVLDANLPGIHGFELCRMIKSEKALEGVRVIMVSAVYRGVEHAREVQEERGADAFLEKPFNVQLLRRQAEQLLGRDVERPPVDEDRAERILELETRVKAAKEAGDAAGERQALEQWVDTDPFDPIARLRLGNLHAAAGDDESAMRALERAVVCDPRLFSAHLNLSRTYLRLGFRKKGVATLEHTRDLAPNEKARKTIEKTILRVSKNAS
jgi:CheY-like chemotaxis protein